MSYRVIKNEDIRKSAASVKSEKRSFALAGWWGEPYTVALVVVDNVFAKAEVHQHAVDVWHVISGEGKFILGGELDSPKEEVPGELVADEISGGSEFRLTPGDVVDIPAGVPHQFDARGTRVELIIFKIRRP